MSRVVWMYWRQALKNLLIAVVLFVLLVEGLVLFNFPVVFDIIFGISIAASIMGVAYVLTIRNPQNYIGFVLGIVSSALLGIQFFLMGSYDLTVLYFFIFIPFQAFSISTWLHAGKVSDVPMRPRYLTGVQRLWMCVCFAILVLLDYVVISLWIDPHAPQLIKWVNGILIGSSVLANFLLIWKKIDSWLLWLLYSVDGLVLALLIDNKFNILLFLFFMVINAFTTIGWMRDYHRQKQVEQR